MAKTRLGHKSTQSDDGWQQTGNQGTGIRNLPPERLAQILENVEKLPYYHFRLHRTDVEGMVRDDGEFILRRGTRNDSDGFTVSVRWEGRLLHFPINWVNGLCCFESKTCTLIQNLIHYYFDSGEPVTERSQAILKKGRTRQSWELLESQLEQGVRIGKGAFGLVFSGTLTYMVLDKPKPNQKPKQRQVRAACAYKTLENAATEEALERARREVLLEARIMRELGGHPNLVKTYGYTVDREVPFVVMEFMSGGSLEKRLRSEPQLTVKTKVRILVEIARGLSYINRSAYIHRDLAARNILYEKSDENDVGIAKITDFGMARKIEGPGGFYQDDPDANLPVVWAAIEAVTEAKYYLKSDVWSMGVIIWEIFSDGSKPYCNLETLDKAAISKHLQDGNRLRANEELKMPSGVDRLMQECMLTSVRMRPPIYNVADRLEDELYNLLDHD